MARVAILLLFVAILVMNVCAFAGNREKRGFGDSGYNSGSGYGRDSDERDASVSGERSVGGCSSGDISGSRELAYNRDGRQEVNGNRRGGRSFSKATASATSSASAFNQNSNIV